MLGVVLKRAVERGQDVFVVVGDEIQDLCTADEEQGAFRDLEVIALQALGNALEDALVHFVELFQRHVF